MSIQALYNKLLIKREYGRGDVVTRLSYEETDILLDALGKTGADVKEGQKHLSEFKQSVQEESPIFPDDKEILKAYEMLRAKANTGKYKDAVGHIHLVNNVKKPIKIVFPSGKEQVYTLEQIEVIERDKVKLNERLQEVLHPKK